MQNTLNNINREKAHIEFLRILGCLLTIYIFVENIANSTTRNSILTLFYYPSACIFFMISGCVLLSKKESLKDVWIKRILRIGFIILGVSFLILIYRRDYDFFSWPHKILFNNVNPYLGFLYVYVIDMICLPFLRTVTRKLSKKNFAYILILKVIWKIVLDIANSAEIIYLPYLNMLFIIINSILYMLIGHWVENVIDIFYNIRYVDICLSIIIGISVLSCFVTKLHLLDDLVFISTFLLVKILFQKYPPTAKNRKIICLGGSLTFGIYLLIGPTQILQNGISILYSNGFTIAAMVGTIVLFIIYGLIVFVLKRIPGLGRIVEWFI